MKKLSVLLATIILLIPVSVFAEAPDWSELPTTELNYNYYDNAPDGLSQIYNDGDYTYFKCTSDMSSHLAEGGGEFTSGISVQINDSWNSTYYPRFTTVASDGTINWNPKLTNLQAGTYNFTLFSTDAWGTSRNINDLNANDVVYGTATVTISSSLDTIEWTLDNSTLAKKYRMSQNDIKTVKVQYGRIGQEWSIICGTPTGYVGVLICVVVAFGAIFVARKKFMGKAIRK